MEGLLKHSNREGTWQGSRETHVHAMHHAAEGIGKGHSWVRAMLLVLGRLAGALC